MSAYRIPGAREASDIAKDMPKRRELPSFIGCAAIALSFLSVGIMTGGFIAASKTPVRTVEVFSSAECHDQLLSDSPYVCPHKDQTMAVTYGSTFCSCRRRP